MNDLERLCQLLRARHACVSIVTLEEHEALGLVRDAALQLSRSCWLWSVVDGVREGLVAGSSTYTDTQDPAHGLRFLAQREHRPLCVTLDLAPHLRNERVLRAWRHTVAELSRSGGALIMIDHSDELPDVVRSYAARFELSFPPDDQLEQIVRTALRNVHAATPLQIEIPRRAWDAVLQNLRGLTRRQIEQVILEAVADDARFDEGDLPRVLASKRSVLQRGSLLEYVEAPVSLDEIGGLGRVKQWLSVRNAAFNRSDPRAEKLPPPRGMLLLGVQGAGKSLCAKAVATAWHRPLLRLDVGALYDRYVGESERRLREALRQTERMAPVILWIDEIEKAFASAASQSNDGGLSRRMFGALLTWMQEHQSPVFLVGTANDIEALPPELLRKGRFDEIFFIDLPQADVRCKIFEIHLRRRGANLADFDTARLAAASDGFSGAEIEQAIISALYEATATGKPLTQDQLLAVLHGSPPLSVVMAEKIAGLRAWARNRCVPAE